MYPRRVLRDIAEYPNSYGSLGPHDERIETKRYTLCMGQRRSWNTVQRQRFCAEEVVSAGRCAPTEHGLLLYGGAMSRPILQQLGFERVGHVSLLLDEFGTRQSREDPQ